MNLAAPEQLLMHFLMQLFALLVRFFPPRKLEFFLLIVLFQPTGLVIAGFETQVIYFFLAEQLKKIERHLFHF